MNELFKQLAKLLALACAAIAAWYADKYVKKKTGKHIHEHVATYIKELLARLKAKAQDYLDTHKQIESVYLALSEVVAAATRARDKYLKVVDIPVHAKPKIIIDKEVPLEEAEVAWKEPVDASQIDAFQKEFRGKRMLVLAC